MIFNYPTCKICGKITLEMHGQDEKYKAYFLDEHDPDTQKVLDTKCYGWCHLKCMSNSEWGAYYFNGLIQYSIKVASYQIVNQNSWLTVLFRPDKRHPHMGSIRLVRDNGWFTDIDLGQWWWRQQLDTGVLIKENGAGFNFDFSSNPTIARSIRERFFSDGSYPLPELIDMLGIQDQLMDSWQLRDAVIKPIEYSPSHHWIVASCAYTQFVPQEIAELVPTEFDLEN